MAKPSLDVLMDAIAQALIDHNVTQRAYGYPIENPAAPCAIVNYPEIEFDQTFNDGANVETFSIFFIVNSDDQKAARNALALIINGAGAIKAALDGNIGSLGVDAETKGCKLGKVSIGGVEYMAAIFVLEVYL